MTSTHFIFRRAVTALSLTAVITTLVFASSAQAQSLTDITLSRLNGSGNTINEGWNTRGGDSISNLYLLNGITPVNAGNGSGASIAIDLSTTGTYTFGFFGENVNNNTVPELSINLFFNSNAANPRISAFGLPGGGFSPHGGTGNTPPFSSVAGANSLSFDNNGLRITLTNFSYDTDSGADQVNSFINTPNGLGDTVGTFTLNVAPIVVVPEMSPLALLALGSIVGGICYRRKK